MLVSCSNVIVASPMPVGPPRSSHCLHFTRFEVLSPRFGPTSQIFTFYDPSFSPKLAAQTGWTERQTVAALILSAVQIAPFVQLV
jgi:hypothetical protein